MTMYAYMYLCVHMFYLRIVYISTFIHVCMYICNVFLCICASMIVLMYICVYLYKYLCMFVSVHMCVYVHMSVCMDLLMYV